MRVQTGEMRVQSSEMKELNEQPLKSVAAPLAPEQSRPATDSAVKRGRTPPAAGQKVGASAGKRRSQPAKRRGRLEREVLANLGKGLKECFADMQRQEVPERFKALLRRL